MNGYIVKVEDGKNGIYLLSRVKNPRTGLEEIGFGAWNGNPYDIAFFNTDTEAQTAYTDLAKKHKPSGVPVVLKVLDF